MATGTYFSPTHESNVALARRRSQAPGSPDEPSWGEWTFDRNGFQDSNPLSDWGVDIAYLHRPGGGVDEYWYCEVGWSDVDDPPTFPDVTTGYICMFSMCNVPVPVPESYGYVRPHLQVVSGSELRVRLPDLWGHTGVVRL